MQRLAIALSVILGASAAVADGPKFTLTGWAEIPHTYRHPGPISGQFTGPGNGVTPPYQGQVIPGFSGSVPSFWPGLYIGLPDNGFGSQGNSADFVIGFYRYTPLFKMWGDGTTSRGPVNIYTHTPFSDPYRLLDASYITGGPVYARETYYADSSIPVDPAIKAGRLLTGADFDVESIALMNDGTYWVGEEFGPYLLHFDAFGQLMSPPVRHPVLRAPQNPQNSAEAPENLPSSRGFEAMARSADGTKLYVTTEASIASETDKRIIEIYEFDTRWGEYTGRVFTYAKDSSDPITGGTNDATNIFVTGDMTNVGGDRYIIIERDDFQGPPSAPSPAKQKKLYLFDLSEVDEATGILKKKLVVDLLDIDDPFDIGGPLLDLPAKKFEFAGQSVEVVTPIDPFTLLVGLDNNYPGGNGRVPGTPDGTELITLRSNVPLAALDVCENGKSSIPPAPFGFGFWSFVPGPWGWDHGCK